MKNFSFKICYATLLFVTLVLFVHSADSNAATTVTTNSTTATNVTTPTPKPPAHFGEVCSADADCVTSLYCNADKKCSCKLGFKFDDSLKKECLPYKCSTDAKCAEQLWGNTKCDKTKSACVCKDNFSLDPNYQTCARKVGQNCTQREDCGFDTECRDGSCHCRFGSTPTKGDFECAPLRCEKDPECVTNFGNNTKCRIPTKETAFCECFPPSIYFLNPTTHSCEKRPNEGKLILDPAITCNQADNDTVIGGICGINTVCNDKKQCQCAFGTIPNDSGLGCKHFACYAGDECGAVFKDSKCVFDKQDCTCMQYHTLDKDNAVCTKDTNYYAFGVIGAAAFLLIGPVVFWLGQRAVCGPQ